MKRRSENRRRLEYKGQALIGTAALLAALLTVSGALKVSAATPDFQEWHNKTEAENMAAIEKARQQGYRVQSVTAYGIAGKERFATVVVRGTGETSPQKVEMRSLAVPVDAIQEETGWNIRQIAASGKRAIVVLEAGGINSVPVYGVGSNAFYERTQEQLRANRRPVSITAYAGTGGTSYFGIYEPNVANVGWNSDVLDSDVNDAQVHYDALSKTGVRLAQVGYTPTGNFYQVWADDSLGSVESRANLTTVQLEQEMGKHYGQGYAPVSLSGYAAGGSTNPADVRFAVIWANHLRPIKPTFTPIGDPAKGGAAIPEIDSEVQKVMEANGIRSASLAVCVGAKLVYARSYSRGATGLALNTTFRQASCQKPFTAAAIYRLAQQGAIIPGTNTKMTLDTRMQDILHLKTPDGKAPTDSRFNDITLRELIAHRSGLRTPEAPYNDPYPYGECLYIDGGTAKAFGKSTPINAAEGASYLASLTLHEAPSMGATIVYNNSNPFLLGLVCAKMIGKVDAEGNLDAFAALRQLIFAPLDLKTVHRDTVSVTDQPGNEAAYLPRVLEHIDPNDNNSAYVNAHLGFTNDISKAGAPLAPAGYGEYNLANWVGPGGTSMSALDAVRLAAALADPNGGGIFTHDTREAYLTDCTSGGRYAFDGVVKNPDGSFYGDKGGSLPTSGNTLYFETAGVSFSFNIAAPAAYPPSFYPSNQVLLDAIRNRSNLKNVDLWEANGYKPITGLNLTFPLPLLPILSLPKGPMDLPHEPSMVQPKRNR